jgi:hypothetical protein
MNQPDIEDASNALIAWCQSQDMSPSDAVLVMTHALTAIMVASAKGQNMDLENVDVIRVGDDVSFVRVPTKDEIHQIVLGRPPKSKQN